MFMPRLSTILLATGFALGGLAPIASAQPHPPVPSAASSARDAPAASADQRPKLPADSTTEHSLTLPGRTLRFTATAGSLQLTNPSGAAEAAIGYVAYQLEGPDGARRPVTFAFNGGPGSASAWLHLGVLGPWRLPMMPDATMPSAPPIVVDNAETWLDFTDLVFIDASETGFSRLLTNSEETRKKYFSVGGDVDSLAQAMRRWIVKNRRMVSPKFIVGESYGGFRGPRLVQAMTEQGMGISGLVLISPKLDYGGRSNGFDPLSWVNALPTEVAAVRAAKGPVTRADVADVEAYAAGEYLVDLLRGEADPAAVERRITKLASLTGLDPALLRKRHGKITNSEFLRARNPGRIASAYDITVDKPDPFPFSLTSNPRDAMTDALSAPFTSAMLELYAAKLNWQPDAQYRMSNETVFRAWEYGPGGRPESMTALRHVLALDPKLRVLVAHGLFDLVIPYFETQLLLNAIPANAGADRVTLSVYPGGHMFYSVDESRTALRAAVLPLYAPR